ncbi:MAG: ACP S-malonyltransferase [Clostridiaceae bacterium]
MGKIAFIFAGQGAQYIGMGKDIAEKYPVSMEVYDKANELLGFDVKELIFNGSIEELNKTENTQPAILTSTIAILKAIESEGIKAEAAAGLSLGEYSALVYGNVLKAEDAIPLVKKRGRFMQEEVPVGVGGMTAVLKLNETQVNEIVKEASQAGIVEVANYNCPGQIVISGEKQALEAAGELIKGKGGRAIPLPVSAPFHSSLLKGAGDKLFTELEKIEINQPSLDIYKNLTGTVYEKDENVKEVLRKQLMSSVRWEETVRNMIADGFDTFVEIGPGKTLTNFVKKINKEVKTFNVENLESLSKTLEGLKEN